MYFRPAYKTAEQRSRGEYKPVHVLVYGFRLVDFDDGKRLNRYRYRADTARFMQHYRAWGRWWYGARRQRFESKFLRPGTVKRRNALPLPA